MYIRINLDLINEFLFSLKIIQISTSSNLFTYKDTLHCNNNNNNNNNNNILLIVLELFKCYCDLNFVTLRLI